MFPVIPVHPDLSPKNVSSFKFEDSTSLLALTTISHSMKTSDLKYLMSDLSISICDK